MQEGGSGIMFRSAQPAWPDIPPSSSWGRKNRGAVPSPCFGPLDGCVCATHAKHANSNYSSTVLRMSTTMALENLDVRMVPGPESHACQTCIGSAEPRIPPREMDRDVDVDAHFLSRACMDPTITQWQPVAHLERCRRQKDILPSACRRCKRQ